MMNRPTPLEIELGQLTAYEAAARLIGGHIIVRRYGQVLRCQIVETEAYDASDPASHSFKGPTKRNRVMFGPPGRAYVYFTYGMHYCLNVVVGRESSGSAVLIRALKPLSGFDDIIKSRPSNKDNDFLNGPAKLTKNLAIDLSLNGHDLSSEPLILELLEPLKPDEIIWSKRIGIRESVGHELHWRACLKGSPYLSRGL